MKLLLAEDDLILADALSASLSKAGFEVEVAPNGAVAEFLLLKQHFDIGVLDLGLPMVDGLTVLKRVRAAKPALPMLVLTALDGWSTASPGSTPGPTTTSPSPSTSRAGGAHPRPAAPLARCRRRRGAAVRQARLRPRRAPRHAGRRAHRAVAARVDAARSAADASVTASSPGPDRRELGGGAQRVGQRLDRGLHPPPAPQARRLRPGDPHRARPGLSARGRRS